ncbi:MAG TPA: polyprenyl synthetase family protein, partial [Isosphaeraceae bacterium]|nr:polyprenyl synthetase family protein [Isosphaeraceae bacterium]
IDNSPIRRGEPALHEALRGDLEANVATDGTRAGRDLGLLAGDLLCSLGMRLLAGSAMEPGMAGRVHRIVSEVLLETGLGEALDVLFETVPLGELTQEDVEEAYVRKTARYSVSGPLILGATLAKADRGIMDALSLFGDRLGLGYQIQNDLDALSEPPDESEHPDLDAGKRTWVLWKAYQNADQRKKEALDELLRLPVSAERRRALFDLILNLGAIEAGEARLEDLRRDAVSALRISPLSGAQRQAFLALPSLFSALPSMERPSGLDALSATPAIPEKAAI